MPSGDIKKAQARPAVERVLAKVRVDESGCWIFTGRLNPKGYGQVMTGSRTDGSRRVVETHIVVWESVNGPTPKGKELDHLCRVHACCNPAHLEPVTHAINTLRGMQHLSGEERERRREWMRSVNRRRWQPEETNVRHR
jgi:hypothetical protein